jgi:thiol-disulfide isomerase/thioredoxin
MVSLNALLLAAVLSGAGETVLLDFSADWCAPCRTMEPTVQRLAAEGFPVRRVNIDQERQLAAQYRVTGVPCFVMLSNGQEVDRVVGATSFDRLVRMFETARTSPPSQHNDVVRAQSPDDRRPPGSRLFGAFGAQQNRIEKETAASATAFPPADSYPVAAASAALSNNAPPPARVSPEQLALAATVRLKVEDARGNSYGTGTIIDSHGDEALIVTCGHLFRDSAGKGKITVDLCAPGATGPIPGQLIRYDADTRDIALVSIRPGIEIAPAQVAPSNYQPRVGSPVFSIGCDRGGQARVAGSRMTAINRYVGPPNFEVAGQPVDGRSGGGLFSADGLLIGVCNAADPADDEGIYAALGTVHWQLDQIGQQEIYERARGLVAQQREAPAPLREFASGPSPIAAPQMPQHMPPANEFQNPRPNAGPNAMFAGATNDRSSLSLLSDVPNGTEIICIVRSQNNPQGRSEILVLNQPSPELLDRLTQEYHVQTSRQPSDGPNARNSDVNSAANLRWNTDPNRVTPQIVRGQSDE